MQSIFFLTFILTIKQNYVILKTCLKVGEMGDKIEKKEKKNLKTKKKKLTRTEKKQRKAYRKANNIPSLWDYIKDYKMYIVLYIFLNLVLVASSIYETILVADAIANITEAVAGQSGLYRTAILQAIILIGIVIVQRLLWMVLAVISNKFFTKVVSKMNNDLAFQTFKFSASTYANNSTGTFVQRIVNDPNRLVGSILNVVDYISSILRSLIISIYIFVLNYIVGLILLVGMIISFTIEKIRLNIRKKRMKISNKKFDKINSLTTEIVKSERDIKSLGLEDKLKMTTEEYYDDYNIYVYKRSVINNILAQSRNIVSQVFGIVALIMGIILLERSLLVFASFMIIYSNRGTFNSLIMQLSTLFDIKNDLEVFGERIFALFDNKEFPVERFGNTKLEFIKGKIEFKDVSYAYVDKLYSNDELQSESNNNESIKRDKVVEHLSFLIEPNTTVAFVGKSGSGKSTILSLMSKMYEVDDGEVTIDDVNINDLTKDSLRNNISLVNQFPYIFDMSIRENLLMAKADASDEELEDAIEKSYLKEFIDTLPDGINTIVGESGIKLSGGQRQRLAIARAFLRKTSIILFDESTSSLDNFAQEHIKDSIDNLKGTSTIVIVAHRLSTIKNVDKIFFLDEGKIIDSGTFDQLFENNQKFHNMFLAENI